MSSMTQQQWDAYDTSGVSTRYMVTSASDAETLVKWSAATDRQTLTRALVEAYSVDLREDIAKITSPTLALGTWRDWHDQLAGYKIDVPKDAFMASFADQFARLPRLPRPAQHDSQALAPVRSSRVVFTDGRQRRDHRERDPSTRTRP